MNEKVSDRRPSFSAQTTDHRPTAAGSLAFPSFFRSNHRPRRFRTPPPSSFLLFFRSNHHSSARHRMLGLVPTVDHRRRFPRFPLFSSPLLHPTNTGLHLETMELIGLDLSEILVVKRHHFSERDEKSFPVAGKVSERGGGRE